MEFEKERVKRKAKVVGATAMIRTSSWKPLFGSCMPHHMTTHFFFKIIFILIKLPDFPLANLIITKKSR